MGDTRYKKIYNRPYTSFSKNIKDGTVEEIKRLRDKGLSYGQISIRLGKSRQRIAQICKKSIKNNSEKERSE